MPKVDKLPAGVKVFARVFAFDVACPACGCVIVTDHKRGGPRLPRRRSRKHKTLYAEGPYNSLIGRLRCPNCRKEYGVGLVLWSVPLTGNAAEIPIPEDWVPTTRQYAALQNYRVGIWPEVRLVKGGPQNLLITALCSCPLDQGDSATDCPVHSYQARVDRQDARWQRALGITDENPSGEPVCCLHCGEELRQDADGDWIDAETHTVCVSGRKHEPRL